MLLFFRFCPNQWKIGRGDKLQDFFLTIFQWVGEFAREISFPDVPQQQQSGRTRCWHATQVRVWFLQVADNHQIPSFKLRNIGGASQNLTYFIPGLCAGSFLITALLLSGSPFVEKEMLLATDETFWHCRRQTTEDTQACALSNLLLAGSPKNITQSGLDYQQGNASISRTSTWHICMQKNI